MLSLEQILKQISDIDGKIISLQNSLNWDVDYVRFHSEHVSIFDPRHRVVGSHTIVNSLKYTAYSWVDNYLDTPVQLASIVWMIPESAYMLEYSIELLTDSIL